MDERKEALAEFLGVDVGEIEDGYAEIVYEWDGEEYLVLTDDEADREFYDYEESLLDDIGLGAFSDWAKDYILDNYVESDWFDDAMRESYEFYVDDIRDESASSDEYENRLEEEMADANCDTEEDFVDYLCDGWSDGIEWYITNFGSEDFSKIVMEKNLIDFDAVIEFVKNEDGRGSSLASYDGEENEQGDYFIYRIG